jgi:hypothetical protein
MVGYNICLFCLRASESRPADFLQAALVRLDCGNSGVKENMDLKYRKYTRCIEFGFSTGIA